MTRNDFEIIAEAVKAAVVETTPTSVERKGARKVAEKLAERLRLVNPRFDRSRFMEACGLTEDKA